MYVCVCVYLCMSVCVGSCVFMLCTSVWMPRTPGVNVGNTVHLLWDRVSLFWERISRQDWLISEPQGSSHHLCLPRAGITNSYHHSPHSAMGSRDWAPFMLIKASVSLAEPYASPLIPISSCSTLCLSLVRSQISDLMKEDWVSDIVLKESIEVNKSTLGRWRRLVVWEAP